MNATQYPVILTYHSISEGDSPLRISPSLFEEQVEWLRTNAHVTSLAEVVSALVEGKAVPERTVVLTFDDGFRDFYSSAAPILRRFELPGHHLPGDRLLRRDEFVAKVNPRECARNRY